MVHPVKPRLLRILGGCESFQSGEDAISADQRVAASLLSLGPVLGVYRNSKNDYVCITEKGLLVVNDKHVQPIFYEKVKNANVIGTKETAVQLSVETQDDQHFDVFIRNGTGKLRDVWEFLRFFDRVVKDLRPPMSPKGFFGKAKLSISPTEMEKKLLLVGLFTRKDELAASFPLCRLEYSPDLASVAEKIREKQYDLIVVNEVLSTPIEASLVAEAIASKTSRPILVITDEPKASPRGNVRVTKPLGHSELIDKIAALLSVRE